MPAGRPSEYKGTETCEIAYKTLCEGLSIEAAAGRLGITRDTIYRWIDKHKEFSDTIQRGLMKRLEFWETLGRNGAAGKIPNFHFGCYQFLMSNIYGTKGPSQAERLAGAIEDNTNSTKELTDRIDSLEKKAEAIEVTPITENKLKVLSGAS